MANIKSAKKRIRVIQRKTLINKMRVSQVKTAIKNFDKALMDGDFDLAQEKLRFVQKKINQVASKGSIHKNAAARKISRLTKKLNAAKQA
ncbi:30S ribosomal protein S20 [Criibacterium bergeronii]|uniref:Small ribosomal subunit protein bS20 n=1 Tax=Criibacterium bergeronii TaxID=1871336 RepID=A0A371IJM4_9FIRM|nr:30S ribosomal protein S20 [Criibacterium bergeronii]MBS6063716.1 30S ribosomal protein S20 [Peptostreptococcaceae bacterium]RDY20689.1 30S ribosomal protein S20 [Criibacterium bergeronii]TRW28292.1 30S ribosomal protein S20 [Criibacterium bergeronii]